MNRQLFSLPSISGLLITLVSMLDSKSFIFGKSHYFLYYLCLALFPRFLMTLDTDLKQIPVTVRVGQAVEVVGQVGRPKTITGFQTHTTPVLLGYNERAELATEEYLSLVKVLEGFVILKKNPEWMDEDK
jgi:26S proteasome regulatory subunit N1